MKEDKWPRMPKNWNFILAYSSNQGAKNKKISNWIVKEIDYSTKIYLLEEQCVKNVQTWCLELAKTNILKFIIKILMLFNNGRSTLLNNIKII